ncbi:MAG: lytic transglycosylase, partial [Pseudorhodobacter sp.]|nr:lytic transglycosylase [Pseudorhodobacter sp.]
GIPKTDARGQYLAYHEGRTGYARQSYLAKPWLVDVSARVQTRSNMYAQQLTACPRG